MMYVTWVGVVAALVCNFRRVTNDIRLMNSVGFSWLFMVLHCYMGWTRAAKSINKCKREPDLICHYLL